MRGMTALMDLGNGTMEEDVMRLADDREALLKGFPGAKNDVVGVPILRRDDILTVHAQTIASHKNGSQ